MKKLELLMGAVGILMFIGGSAANAATDTVQAPTGWFVPTDAQKYNSPYYRWYNEDWGWTHNAIAGSPSSASLSVSAFDVDNDGSAGGEWDEIYAKDNGTWVSLGYLAGASDVWSYTTFTLGNSFFDDIQNGLEVYMDIDTAHTYDNWAVTLAKSVLTVDGGVLPPPQPGVPDGGSTMLLLGVSAVALGTLKRRLSK